MKIFIFIEWALFHSQSLCYVINIYISDVGISFNNKYFCTVSPAQAKFLAHCKNLTAKFSDRKLDPVL